MPNQYVFTKLRALAAEWKRYAALYDVPQVESCADTLTSILKDEERRTARAAERVTPSTASGRLKHPIWHAFDADGSAREQHCCGCWEFHMPTSAPARIVAECNECGEVRDGYFPGVFHGASGCPAPVDPMPEQQETTKIKDTPPTNLEPSEEAILVAAKVLDPIAFVSGEISRDRQAIALDHARILLRAVYKIGDPRLFAGEREASMSGVAQNPPLDPILNRASPPTPENAEYSWIDVPGRAGPLINPIRPAPQSLTDSEQAIADAETYGTGFLVDGKRIAPEKVIVLSKIGFRADRASKQKVSWNEDRHHL